VRLVLDGATVELRGPLDVRVGSDEHLPGARASAGSHARGSAWCAAAQCESLRDRYMAARDDARQCQQDSDCVAQPRDRYWIALDECWRFVNPRSASLARADGHDVLVRGMLEIATWVEALVDPYDGLAIAGCHALQGRIVRHVDVERRDPMLEADDQRVARRRAA
jgi:hypothetical protein